MLSLASADRFGDLDGARPGQGGASARRVRSRTTLLHRRAAGPDRDRDRGGPRRAVASLPGPGAGRAVREAAVAAVNPTLRPARPSHPCRPACDIGRDGECVARCLVTVAALRRADRGRRWTRGQARSHRQVAWAASGVASGPSPRRRPPTATPSVPCSTTTDTAMPRTASPSAWRPLAAFTASPRSSTS